MRRQPAGARRPPLSETFALGALLAAAGGFLDAYTYLLRGGVFANAQTGNHAAVNAEAALMNIEDLNGIVAVRITGVENHIIQAGTDYAENNAGDHAVEELILIDMHFFAAQAGIEESQNQTDGNDDAVPVHCTELKRTNLNGSKLKGDRVHVKFNAQPGKGYLIHMFHHFSAEK